MRYFFPGLLSFSCASLALISAVGMSGQTLKTRPAEPKIQEQQKIAPDSISLTVPSGTPLKVALDREVRIRHAGQPVHGKTIEPIYSFDKLLIPQGSEV